MSNFDRKLGNRGGSKDRPSKRHSFSNYLESRESKGTSTTAKQCESGILTEGFEEIDTFYNDKQEEITKEEWLRVYRQSYTARNFLRLLPQQVLEVRSIKSRQLDQMHYKLTGEIKMITVIDQIVVKMSDKTLLTRGNPVSNPDGQFKRVTSVTKRTTRPDLDHVEPRINHKRS